MIRKQEDYRAVVSTYLPIRVVTQIDELAHRNRIKNRNEAIRQLLEVGLFVESKIGLVETWTSKEMDDIRTQMDEGQLVDWIQHMDQRKFSTLMHIFEDESKARGLTQKRLD